MLHVLSSNESSAPGFGRLHVTLCDVAQFTGARAGLPLKKQRSFTWIRAKLSAHVQLLRQKEEVQEGCGTALSCALCAVRCAQDGGGAMNRAR